MSSDVIQAERNDRLAAASFVQRPWIVCSIVALGFGPLLYCHVVGLLERPHYQFLLFLPFALWILIASLPARTAAASKPASNLDIAFSALMLGVSAVGLAFATWSWSPWIAAVSGMLAFFSLLLFIGGRNRAVRWFPVWMFCWILIPLPFGMDEDLIVGLRTVTTTMTSAVLDQLGILHQTYANVIELPGKPLFVADACSGIHSLYVLMAMALFLTMFQRRSLLHAFLLLCSTFGLVLVENVARIVTVAAGLGWRMDLSIGFNHTLLGVLLFCASAVLIFTTDQLLLFLLPTEPFRFLLSLTGRPVNPSKPAVGSPAFRSSSGLAVGTWLVVAFCFPILGIAQLTRLPSDIPTLAALFPDDFDLPKLGVDAMPGDLAGFTRESYETIDRVVGDPFGKSSQRWVYSKGALTVGVSLDYPYDGVKDLCECYSLVGWQIPEKQLLDEKMLSASFDLRDAAGSIAQGKLFRELFGNGYLLFSSFDLTGKSSALVKEIARGDVDRRIGDRLKTFGMPASDSASGEPLNPPYIQVHLLARSFEALTPEVERELMTLFIESRKLLIPQVLKVAGQAPASDQNKGVN